MATLIGEGFENTVDLNSAEDFYGAGNFTQGTGANFGVSGGHLQGKYFQGGTGLSTWKIVPAIVNPFVTADPYIIFHCRIRAWNPVNALQFFQVFNGANLQCRLQMIDEGASGDYRVRVMNSAGAEVGITLPLVRGIWHYLEFKVTVNNSGAWNLRINEVSQASGTSDMFLGGSAAVDQMVVNIQKDAGGSDLFDIDDVSILMGSTGTNVDFLGDGTLERLECDAAGTTTQFTPVGAATNRECIDDVAPDDDSTYVHTNQVGIKDTYGIKDLVFATAGVPLKYIVRRITGRLLSAGSRNVELVLREGGTEHNNATTRVNFSTTSYVEKAIVNELDPITGSAFDVATLNAAQMGMVTVP